MLRLQREEFELMFVFRLCEWDALGAKRYWKDWLALVIHENCLKLTVVPKYLLVIDPCEHLITCDLRNRVTPISECVRLL